MSFIVTARTRVPVVFLLLSWATARALAQARPELVLQAGHAGSPAVLAGTVDGTLIASADGTRGDGTVKLWQVSTGRQLRTLIGHSGGVVRLAFSPDGKLIASGNADDTIRIWEVATGRQLQQFYVPWNGVSEMIFSVDNHYLVSVLEYNVARDGPGPPPGRDREINPLDTMPQPCAAPGRPGFCEARDITVWDVREGRFLYSISPPAPDTTPRGRWFVDISPDGQVLATGLGDRSVVLREIATGRTLPPLPDALAPFLFDPTGRLLAARLRDGSAGLWDFSGRQRTATLGHGIPVAFSADSREVLIREDANRATTVRVWDAETGTQLRQVILGREYDCPGCEVYISPDGAWAARGGFGQPALAVWDIRRPTTAPRLWYGLSAPLLFNRSSRLFAAFERNIWTLGLRSNVQSCFSVPPVGGASGVALATSPTTQAIRWLATSTGGAIALWDAQSGVRSFVLPGHDERVSRLSFVPLTSHLVSVAEPSNQVVTWLPGIRREGDTPSSLVWRTPDCEATPIIDRDSTLRAGQGGIWDVVASRLLFQLGDSRNPLAVAPAGGLMASSSASHSWIRLWDTRSGNELPTLDEGDDVPGRLHGSTDYVSALAIHPASAELAAASSMDSVISIWDTRTATRRGILRGHRDRVAALAYNPVTGLLASTGWDNTVRLWNTTLGTQQGSWTLPVFAHAVVFRLDGERLAVAAGDEVVEYDQLGHELMRFAGHNRAVGEMAYSNDGALLVTGSSDGTARIWDDTTGALLATLVSFAGEKNWLVVGPDGLFDGSESAWKQILWRFNGNTFDVTPVEPFFRDFYHPGLLAEILAGKRPKALTDIATIDRRQPMVSVAVKGGRAIDRHRAISVLVQEAPADRQHRGGSGVRDVRLFRNGALVKVWRGNVPLDRSGKATLVDSSVTVVAGENRFTAYAFSQTNIKSGDTTVVVTGAAALARKGVVHIIAIGINKYADPRFNLTYARSDADDFGTTLKASQVSLGMYSGVRVIPLSDSEATKRNVLDTFGRLHAQPEDVVFIYYAGHGAAPGKGSNRFYLLLHDFRPPRGSAAATMRADAAISGAISDLELGSALEGIDAGQIALVIDACQSGATLESDDPRQGPMNSRGLAQLAYEKGMYILAAAQSDQAANELAELGHGLLTYSLVEEGLKKRKASGSLASGQIALRDWLEYPTARVPELQLEAMRRMAAAGQDVSIVPGQQARGVDAGERAVQRPRVFFRRGTDVKPLVIAKPP